MNNNNREIEEKDVELLERYAAALEKIEALHSEMGELEKQDIEEAERYLSVLQALNDMFDDGKANFNEGDIEEAERYLKTLIGIKENE